MKHPFPPRPTRRARGRIRSATPQASMNKLEARYALYLDLLQLEGSIHRWRYEEVKFRLADGAWFLPDFWVQMESGYIEVHETKGFMREAGRLRLRVAAKEFPELRFVLVREDRKPGHRSGTWDFEEIPA